MITFIIVMTMISFYAAMGGGVGTAFNRWRIATCPKCIKEKTPLLTSDVRDSYYRRLEFESRRCNIDHETPAFFVGLGWPVLLPVIAGHLVAARPTKGERIAKKQKALEESIEREEALIKRHESLSDDYDREIRRIKGRR